MPKKQRYAGIRRTATRSALLAAAEELFGQHGFAEVSIDQITVRAGVAKGSFYNHFIDKADLAHHLALEIRAGVIPPFLVGLRSRHHAAMASRCFGVIPPKAMFGRS